MVRKQRPERESDNRAIEIINVKGRFEGDAGPGYGPVSPSTIEKKTGVF